ncbi:MAG: hypothetical protein QNK85_05650, partial [Crocinitomicaceae bacterium]
TSMSYLGQDYPVTVLYRFMTNEILSKEEWFSMNLEEARLAFISMGQSEAKAEKNANKVWGKEGQYEMFVENKKSWDKLIADMFTDIKANVSDTQEDDW